MMRIMVIGLDGATWNLIDPLVESGKLPNIKRIKENGVYGDLKSSIPPSTFPAWKCYSTGKNPGNLGSSHFYRIDLENENIEFTNSTSFKSKEIWDYLGEEGFKSAVINMPTTYPVKEIYGILIAGYCPGEHVDYTYPKELKQELISKYNYRLDPKFHPRFYVDQDKSGMVNDIMELIQTRFDLAHDIFKDYDFVHLTIFHIDTLQHFMWGEEDLEKAWVEIDKNIGQFLDSGYNILLMSDHGFTELKGVFFINTWLEKNGYLVVKEDLMRNLLFKIGINAGRLYRVFQKLRLLNFIKTIVPKSIQMRVPTEDGFLEREGIMDRVDFKKSTAIDGGAQIYINAKGKEKEKILKKLKRELSEIKHPKTGEKVIQEIYEKEEEYQGAFLDRAPDLLLLATEGYWIYEGVGGDGSVFDFRKESWKAIHKLYGIFMASGPDIAKGKEIEGAEIIDLAPTILHMMGVDIPKDMDGKVLREIFNRGSDLYSLEIKVSTEEGKRLKDIRLSDDEADEVKERLRGLGYL